MITRVKLRKAAAMESTPERCDIKVWSGECERSDSRTHTLSYLEADGVWLHEGDADNG